MMREILFRGKRIDNSEWIEGSHLADGEAHRPLDEENMPFSNCYIVPETDLENIQTVFNDGSYFLSVTGYHVIPETVGQFTGLTDKNGTKIFEGDVVVSYSIFGRKDGCGIVNWNNLFSAWEIGGKTMYGTSIATYEVIGNIHDNPEPLEGERQ